MKKIINWFKQSNRYKHLYAGILIYIFYTVLLVLLNNSLLISTIVGTISTVTHMISVEYKDKLYGSKFNYKDILAGIIVPVVSTLCYILYELL